MQDFLPSQTFQCFLFFIFFSLLLLNCYATFSILCHPSSTPRACRHHRGSAHDGAHWQARVAVTYCLLMECDKSCGNAGVHGSQSLGVEYVSMPACVSASNMCVRPHELLPFCVSAWVCLCVCVFVRNVLVWGRRAWLRPFTAHLAQIGPPGWWGSSTGGPGTVEPCWQPPNIGAPSAY